MSKRRLHTHSFFAKPTSATMKLSSAHGLGALALALALPLTTGATTRHGSQSSEDLTVNTTSGLFLGHVAAGYSDVRAYLGIPFAEPPVDSLRFAAPQAYAPTNATVVRSADTLPQSCMQPALAFNASWPQNVQKIFAAQESFRNNTSEDCLYLNVWTPANASSAAVNGSNSSTTATGLKPVLLWFHGGAFQYGGASDSSQQGAVTASAADVVAVNFNYRVNVFGFSGAPGEAQRQNVALLDQRLAVEWVRDNAAAFGGDPARITIYGHSAGGSSVDLYTYAWADADVDPIIAASGPLSGTATSFGNRLPNTTLAGWTTMAGLLGCNSSDDDDDVMACVRSQDAQDVLNASLNASLAVIESMVAAGDIVGAAYASSTGTFGPTVDNRTVFASYPERAALGKFIQVPIITGSNDDETCFFVESGDLDASESDLINWESFTCPAHYAGAYRAAAGLPAWTYRAFGIWSNLDFDRCPSQPWHGAELYPLYAVDTALSGQDASASEMAFGAYFRRVWAAFAYDPYAGLLPRAAEGEVDEGLAWPRLEANASSLIALARNGTAGIELMSASPYMTVCEADFKNGAINF